MFSKIWKDIKNGQIAPIYCIYGEETYFIDETIKKIKQALNTTEETETINFDLEESPVDFVLDEADTFPFFSEKKLILAKNASFLKAMEKGKEKIEHDLKRLEMWLNNPSDFAIVIFIAPYEKLDERKKITKLMKEKCTVLHAETPKENDLAVWIRTEVNRFNKTIQDEAVDKLVEMVGANMLQLQIEIEKICLYLGEQPMITTDIVEDLVAKTLEHDAFKMLNAYLSHQNAEAIQIYHDLLRQKEEPIMLVGLLASNIRTMNNVYYLQKKGYHATQISKQLKIHPYRVKLMVENRNRPSEERLLKALHSLSEIDLKLKSVGGNRERLLEMFLLRAL
ncbi:MULTISPECIES: DNA polymerase III subunit delta [Lysinibacillus]|uniref:DNA polymerase III subunit delta n=1 Tax=Lysinibacillus antri TaxID=2498145 RepID=A0A432LGM7_9BACI|nr:MULTISPECIES: DNA polymerase III subunit delta [Lysinibacillus]RUL57067.1 DNA polymerase III subunit delta [Lysinibacillus antri]TSI03300.1 DNA polymerase III subunit delta [Lysinibacillus sp. BW-2-10]